MHSSGHTVFVSAALNNLLAPAFVDLLNLAVSGNQLEERYKTKQNNSRSCYFLIYFVSGPCV